MYIYAISYYGICIHPICRTSYVHEMTMSKETI